MHPFICGVLLLGLALMEKFAPGWNGWFYPATSLPEAEARLLTTIYLTGSFICFALGWRVTVNK